MSDSTSVFSPRARWEVPPISERQTQPGMNEWFAFRGHLTISGPWEVPVCLRIAADSKYWLYVNGTLVVREGGLKRTLLPSFSGISGGTAFLIVTVVHPGSWWMRILENLGRGR